tara:strand:- start:12584 stop:12883 length:300 start_codon:yes stop_codon:yes gene_type:complete
MLRHMEYMRQKLEETENEIKYLSGKNKEDMVNSPAHYNKAGMETIDMIESVTGGGFEAYLQGNILKYLCRYKYKNGVEDLEKAKWYLNRLIQTIKKGED